MSLIGRFLCNPCSSTGYARRYADARILLGTRFGCLRTTSGIHTSSNQREVGGYVSMPSKGMMNARMIRFVPSYMAYASRFSGIHSGYLFPAAYGNMMHYNRSYSSHAESNRDMFPDAVSSDAAGDAPTGKATDLIGSEWVDALKDAVAVAGKRAKDASNELVPYMQKLNDSNPYLEKVLVPVGGTLTATLLAWLVMPTILRKLHRYALRSPLSLLSRGSTEEQVPYEKSMWHALEDPARYLVTFMSFSQLGVIIAPSTFEYLPQAWRAAIVLSFVWFLQRWKTNLFSSAMANQATIALDREKLLALEKMSSVGLFVLGAMASAEACGVPLQSLLTIGGIGGVATAYASRDILGNLFSGLSLQFSKPFSVGDYIKAGSIEGQVVDMGLTTTSLLSPDKYPVSVPNSLFASQVIVNRSRAQWCVNVTKIPVRIDDIDKIPLVSEEIKYMLRSNANVFLEKDAPYCYLSRIDNSCAEITLGCNLKNMKKDELFATKQEILLGAAGILKQHGVELGSTQ